MINYTKLSTYDYHLPEQLIAQTPLEKRDESALPGCVFAGSRSCGDAFETAMSA